MMIFRNLDKPSLNFKEFLKVDRRFPYTEDKIKCSKRFTLLTMPFRIKNLISGCEGEFWKSVCVCVREIQLCLYTYIIHYICVH